MPTESTEPEDAVAAYEGLSEARRAILTLAASEIGRVSAHEPEGDEDGRPLRKGWECLLAYFDEAYGASGPNTYKEADVKFYSDDRKALQAWCGIFALFCIRRAGVGAGHWRRTVGIGNLLGGTLSPAPGDVGYLRKGNHHCIVERVDGDLITTIDGNTTVDGQEGMIARQQRSKREFAAFYTVDKPRRVP